MIGSTRRVGVGRLARVAIAAATVLALAACLGPLPAPTPTGSAAPDESDRVDGSDPPLASIPPVTLPANGKTLQTAVLLEPLVPRLGDRPDGPQLLSEPDGRPMSLEAGRRVTILGDPQPGPDAAWVRVWVEPSVEAWPGDYYAWLPTTKNQRPVLDVHDPIACPVEATLQTLAPLVQQNRRRCAEALSITIDGRTGELGSVPLYDVNPAWYGTNAGPRIPVLYDPGPVRFGPGAKLRPEEAGAWIEPRVPPGVPPLPFGFFVRLTGQFDDPSAATCRRAILNAVPGLGPPAEVAADSVEWCRDQFVVSAWQALLGPEGRPIDLAAPQLHRREWVIPAGAGNSCAGVGMAALTIRIDPSQIDPVWIESGPQRFRSLAMFGPEFRFAVDPVRVQAANGATLVNGEVVDPDRGKPGIAVCPGGSVISFNQP